MDLSFQEKSVWASLIGVVVVFGYYFYLVLGAPEEASSGHVIALFIVGLVVLTVIEIVLHIIIALSNIKDAEDGGAMDERDRAIWDKACRNAYYILFVGALCLTGQIVVGDLMSDPTTIFTPVMSANFLLFSLVFAELVKFASQLFYYRRGI